MNSYVVIDLLLNHLDKYFDKKSRGNVKTSIMNVIHDCLVFAATNTGASRSRRKRLSTKEIIVFSTSSRFDNVRRNIESSEIFKEII